jgi:hypothetical protein
MAEVSKKRKATRALEEATKRMRIETLSTSGMRPTYRSNAIPKILTGAYRGRSFQVLRERV